MKLWNLKGKKILIVDDFHEMRSLTQSMLLPFNPDVIKLARDGNEAISLMEETRFDIVLCDYNLGKGRDGQQILEEARHRALLPCSAIYIMITAENTTRMVMGAIDHLPDDYISKPFTRTTLQNRLQKLLERKSSLHEIARAMDRKMYHRAIELCDEKLTEKPRNRLELLKTRTELLIKLGRYDDALEQCEEVLDEREVPWARLNLGRASLYLGRLDDAEDIFAGMIKDNPANAIAHDFLARTLEQSGDLHRAQEVISEALRVSPKSILRQRKLGQLALSNGDYAVSESAYREAVAIGRHSCYRDPQDYSQAAKCMLQRGAGAEALKFVGKLGSDSGEDNSDTRFHEALVESLAHDQRGDEEKSAAALARAVKNFSRIQDKLSADTVMDFADTCLGLGDRDAADAIIATLVRNHHDDSELLEKTRRIYTKAGLADEGAQVVSKAREEVIEVNSRGAELLRDGRLEESIELFVEAARGIPENVEINLNTAFAMIKLMEETGLASRYGRRALKYLEKVHELDPGNKKYYQLLETLQSLTARAA